MDTQKNQTGTVKCEVVNIGELVKYLMRRNNVKLKEIGDLFGVTRQGASNIIEKENFKVDQLQKLANYFNVSLGYFFGWDEGPTELGKNLELEVSLLKEKIATLEKLVDAKEEIILNQREIIKLLQR